MASNKTSNQTSENQDDNQWPRFIIMEAADQNVPLNLNAFVWKKAIDGMANAELDNVKPMKSGGVFIEVETKQQCKNLLKTTKLLGYLPVKVSPHRTLNSSKFVIKCDELDKMDDEEIKKRTSATRNHCCEKNLHMIESIRFNHQRINYSKKDQYWIPEKRNTTVHSQPSKFFYNARNLDTPRINVKVKLFVLDVVKKDTI